MVMRRLARAVAIASVACLGAARTGDAHPLHSTITELVEDRAHGTVRATIRVFADDFATAVARAAHGKVNPASGAAWDAAVLAYASSAFGLQDAQGRALALRACGTRRTSDLLWLCLEATATQPLATMKVRDAVLCDLFDDQVNVVQGTLGTERRSVLFVRGDRYKPLH